MDTIVTGDIAARLTAGEYVAVWFGRQDPTGTTGFPVPVTKAERDGMARPAARWRLWFGDCPTFDDGASVGYAADRVWATATAADVAAWLVTLAERNAADAAHQGAR